MNPASELERQIRRYLDKQMPLEDLQKWFRANKAFLFSLQPGSRPLELATALELGLIELESPHQDFSERHLKRELRAALGSTSAVA